MKTYTLEILRNPLSPLSLFAVGLLAVPLLGLYGTLAGSFDPIIGIFYTIPQPEWKGRGVCAAMIGILFVQPVIAAFVYYAFFSVEPRKPGKRTKQQ